MNINFEILERTDKNEDGQIETIKVLNMINKNNNKTICIRLSEYCSMEILVNDIKEFLGDDCINNYHFSYSANISGGNNE